MIFAGDIGGTKSHLALYAPGDTPRRPSVDRVFQSRDYPSLEALCTEFLDRAGEPPPRTVFGIAGPVVNNRVEATNLPWRMDGEALGRTIGSSVTFMNDLEAAGWGLPLLGPKDLETLQVGSPARGNRALIAAGTGLGESILIWNGADWRPSPSEGGHADFGPRDPLEDELLVWLRARYGRASYERILSGPGLADLYRFMTATDRGDEPPVVAERFAAASDPAALVTETALDGSCERAAMTLRKFVEIYAAEAGNLALKGFAVGGVFMGGGIAPKILPFLREESFVHAFQTKGRLTAVLEDIPIAVILAPETALWGAARCAMATPETVEGRALRG
jgi:glucokinase